MKSFAKIKKFKEKFAGEDEDDYEKQQKIESKSGETSLVCRAVQTYEDNKVWTSRKRDQLRFCQSNRKFERIRYSDGGFFNGFDLRVPSVVVRLKKRQEAGISRNPSCLGLEKRMERSSSGDRVCKDWERELPKVQNRLGFRRCVEVKRKKRVLRIVDNPRNALIPINLFSKQKH